MNIRELNNTRQKVLVYSLVLIPFLLFCYILIVPLGTSVYYSLCTWKGIGDPKFVGFANYLKLYKDSNFWLVVKNTLVYSLYCTIGQVGIRAGYFVAADREKTDPSRFPPRRHLFPGRHGAGCRRFCVENRI